VVAEIRAHVSPERGPCRPRFDSALVHLEAESSGQEIRSVHFKLSCKTDQATVYSPSPSAWAYVKRRPLLRAKNQSLSNGLDGMFEAPLLCRQC